MPVRACVRAAVGVYKGISVHVLITEYIQNRRCQKRGDSVGQGQRARLNRVFSLKLLRVDNISTELQEKRLLI